MSPTDFTATLLRASANGFAGLAASRTSERAENPSEQEGGFDAWQAHFKTLVGELAAAVEDGGVEAFAATIAWNRDAFQARGLSTEILLMGLEELESILHESLPPAAWKPLPPFFEAARTPFILEGESHPGDEPGAKDGIVEAYVAKLLEGDAPASMATVTDVVEAGKLSVPDALEGVLINALKEIGRLWHAGEINIAQEHFATQVNGRLLERLLLMAPASPSNGHTVMLTMVEGDAHDLGLRVVSALFELDGWRTICLGANMPTSDLPQATEIFGVDLILLGATLNTQREQVARAIEMLREVQPHLKILVGGRAFAECEERALEIGANGCALLPRRAVELGRALVDS